MSDAAFYFQRGLDRLKAKEYELALEDYQRAIEMDPNEALYYNARGVAYG